MSSTRALVLGAALLAAACTKSKSKPDADPAPGSAREGDIDDHGLPACGTVIYALGDGHDHGRTALAQLSLEPGAAPQVLDWSALDSDGERPRSRYPAALSPDGTKLLILASLPSPDGKTHDRFELLELGSDGPPQVLDGPRDVVLRNPSWAPDASFFVFESAAESFRDLYRYDLASATTLRLSDDAEGNFEPAVSPDGQSIAFVSSRTGNPEIFVMTADGGDPRQLTDSPGSDSRPRWSPDASEIAFTSARDRGRVFALPAGGGEVVAVSPALDQVATIRDLSWSPTGTHLAFTGLAGKREAAAVFVVERASGSVVLETAGPGIDEQPSWSPDGTALLFTRGIRERSDLYRTSLDAPGQAIRVTSSEAVAWLPRWTIAPGQDCARAEPQVRPATNAGNG